MRRLALTIAALATTALVAEAAGACAVCYGAADDAMTRGMNNGILTLLSVVGVVQLGFVAMFASFWWRGKKRRDQRDKFQLLDGGAR